VKRTNDEIMKILKQLTIDCEQRADIELLNKIDYDDNYDGLDVVISYIYNKLHYLFIKYVPYDGSSLIYIDVDDNFFNKYLDTNIKVLTYKE